MSSSQTHYDGQFTLSNFKLVNSKEPETTFVNGFFRGEAWVRNLMPLFDLEIVYAFKDSWRLVMTEAFPFAAMGITAGF